MARESPYDSMPCLPYARLRRNRGGVEKTCPMGNITSGKPDQGVADPPEFLSLGLSRKIQRLFLRRNRNFRVSIACSRSTGTDCCSVVARKMQFDVLSRMSRLALETSSLVPDVPEMSVSMTAGSGGHGEGWEGASVVTILTGQSATARPGGVTSRCVCGVW